MTKKNYPLSIIHFSLRKGFTLIELVIVMGLLAVLVVLGLTSYMRSQNRGRDARRQGDIKALQGGFEQYYAVNGSYPSDEGELVTEFAGGSLPVDPQNVVPYQYAIDYSTPGGGYCACAYLGLIDGNATDSVCTYSEAPLTGETRREYFCVSNLQ